ncbi:MAG: RagB/SusD family nutrient uptake outer membrane protein [Prevotellaceae bacterium]|jgi:hypothetical protein|nr:RagB/SusD family nutrient uptake outer membrane protein [Prevotellaceae bacterium]
MKRNILKITIISCFSLIGLLFISSCEKDVVELVPIDRFTPATVFDTYDHCDLAVKGVYALAQSGVYPAAGAERGYPFGAASIEQSDMRGEDMMNIEAFFQVTYEANYTTTSAPNNDGMWENTYSVVNGANIVIDGLEGAIAGGVLTAAEGESFIAECKFIRALSIHNLLIHFARPFAEQGNKRYGVPYYDYPINTPEAIERGLAHGRNTLDECYAKIIEDLDYAESKIPKEVSRISRVTQGAAIALKVRVKLHKGDWTGSKAEAAKLINASMQSPIGGYAIEPDPMTPFANYTSNKESIFSIDNSPLRNPSVNGSLPSMYSVTALGGRALISLSPVGYNNPYWLDETKDKRRDMFRLGSYDLLYLRKYEDNVSAMSQWAPIIRYAEVLLTYAELIIRTGGSVSDALPYLNSVRNRSLINSPVDAYTVSSFADTKEFMKAVLGERRIEFLGEGRRWEDIHRLFLDPDYSTGGIPAKPDRTKIGALMNAGTPVYIVGGTVPADAFNIQFIPYSDRRCVFPIPINSVSRNPLLASQQNEGW